MRLKSLRTAIFVSFVSLSSLKAQVILQNSAPGGPGQMITWPNPQKDAVATTLNQPLWLTTVRGAITEIAFPYVDRVQTRDSYLIVRSASGRFDERQQFETHRYDKTLAYWGTSTSNGIKLTKKFLIHPSQASLIIDYQIQFSNDSEKEIIFIHNPTAEHTSGGDEMIVQKNRGYPILFAYQKDLRGDEPEFLKPSAYQSISWSIADSDGSTGFYGVNSPIEAIERNENLPTYTQASFGNVAGALRTRTSAREVNFRVVISFTTHQDWKSDLAHMTDQAMLQDFSELLRTQQREWDSYLSGLNNDRGDKLSESSILVLKSAEDKINRGAFIAAPANPSIPWHVEAPEHPYESSRKRLGDSNAGYRRVWPRDLYHKSIAFLSVGDYATAVDIARWYKKVQLKGFRDGAWAQNMNTLGEPSWNAFQIDQTGLPLVLIQRLVGLNQISYSDFQDMVVRAANFILIAGPNTDQERWEENGGLSPNSLATAVEGLLAAAQLEEQYGENWRAKNYRDRALNWTAHLKDWTLVRQGAYGSNYFPRLEIGRDGYWRPDLNDEIFIQNKAPGAKNKYREDEILDGGFLQWIISGLVNPLDEDFSRTIGLYDRYVRKNTPYGTGYLRYNYDSYGENHLGGIWPILSAERAIAAIERNEPYQDHLKLIQQIATPTGLIGEQDTLAVRPLEWSHAAYLILKRSIKDSRSYYRISF